MYEKLKINNLREKYLELINYEISYKHYVLFLFVYKNISFVVVKKKEWTNKIKKKTTKKQDKKKKEKQDKTKNEKRKKEKISKQTKQTKNNPQHIYSARSGTERLYFPPENSL